MKITNTTQFRTSDLRRLFEMGLAVLGASMLGRRWLIYVNPCEDRWYRGRAGIGDNWIEMRIPKTERLDVKQFAQVFGQDAESQVERTGDALENIL